MGTTRKKRILVVEDENHIAEGLRLNLSLQGYEVSVASDGVKALNELKKFRPDLVVLDIMLPGIDGYSVLRSIRLENERLPVLILTARGAPDDKVKGFSYGTDDYLVKPFDLEEFLLRVKRLLTRVAWNVDPADLDMSKASPVPATYTFGNNLINFETSKALCKNRAISLTDQEVRLLKLFILNRGKPLSRNKLLEIGWGYTGKTETRTVDNFIVRFRKYFEDNPKKPQYFKSLRSVGYMFDHA
ncbi:MAG: response regulator transcription factor [Desulfobacterales bacterium]|nr:response regulator transcription factor [Desulfobacterales bacterium]